MSQMLDYKGKQLLIRVGNYRSAPICMSVVGEHVPAKLFNFPMNVTTNLGENIKLDVLMPKYCAYVDVSRSDSKELLQFIKDNNLGQPYVENGKIITDRTGFTDYPLYQFNANRLRELDPEGCMKYEQAYSRAASIHYSTECMRSYIRNNLDNDLNGNDFGD